MQHLKYNLNRKEAKLNLKQIICDELDFRGLKKKYLAKYLELSESRLSQKLQNFDFSAIELAKIQKLLNLKPALIFKAIEEGEKAKNEKSKIKHDTNNS